MGDSVDRQVIGHVKSIPDLLGLAAKEMVDHTALIYFGREISYRTLYNQSRRTAFFVKHNSRPDDRVGVFMPNIPQFVFSYYGALIAERIAVPINFISIAGDLKKKKVNEIKITEEIVNQLHDSKPRVIFVSDLFYPILIQAGINWKCTVVIASAGDWLPWWMRLLYPIKARKMGIESVDVANDVFSFDKVVSQALLLTNSPIDPNKIAQFQYTGGTTGISKNAMLTHRNLVANCIQIREHFGKILEYKKEVVLGALPLCHIYGMTTCLNMTLLSLASKLVLVPKFEPEEVVKIIRKHKVTIFPGVNRMYQAIIDCSGSDDKENFGSLKLCLSGAGAIDKKVCDRFKELSNGLDVVEGYGLSEASPVVSATLPNDLSKSGSVPGLIGRPVPYTDVKICDENGNELSSGLSGEIIVRGPQVMAGYYNKPEETLKVLKNGWLKTGDIGHMDNNGYLYITDRIKDMIKVLGENVYPSRLEEWFKKVSIVSEVVVVGLPNPKRGEALVAVVVLNPDVNVGDPVKHFGALFQTGFTLGPNYIPAGIKIVDSLEQFKNPIGKIYKRKIREFLLEQNNPALSLKP